MCSFSGSELSKLTQRKADILFFPICVHQRHLRSRSPDLRFCRSSLPPSRNPLPLLSFFSRFPSILRSLSFPISALCFLLSVFPYLFVIFSFCKFFPSVCSLITTYLIVASPRCALCVSFSVLFFEITWSPLPISTFCFLLLFSP